MPLDLIMPGHDVPDDVDFIIEIPLHSDPIVTVRVPRA